MPENPTLIESLSSWNHHKPMKPIEVSSFAEIFGELYFQEKPVSPATILPVPTPPPLAPPALDQDPQPHISDTDSKNVEEPKNPPLSSIFGLPKNRYRCDVKGNGGFSTKNSESLLLCTEGLGSESSDDVDDLLESGDDWRTCGKGKMETGRQLMYNRFNGNPRCCLDVNSSKNKREFPPPISSIGKGGKPWVCLKSYREDGRFVLREMRIPTQELLRASREDGRLKLHFVHPDEDIAEGEGEEQEQDGDGEQDEEAGQETGGGETKMVGEGENCQ